MKKLICAEDIEVFHKEGKQSIAVNKQTIITPSAKDLAEEYQMTFAIQERLEDNLTLSNNEKLSKEFLVALLRQVLKEENIVSKPFEFDKHKSGLTIVKGQSIKPQPINNANKKVCYQEIITAEASNYSAGILEIEASTFHEEKTLESMYYIISGELRLMIEETNYTAYEGDTIFIPKNCTVSWSTPNKVTMICGKLKGVGKE